MNQQSDLQALVARLEENTRKQLFHARIQTVFSVICAVICGILLLKLLPFIPKLDSLLSHADALLGDLEAVTKELSTLDLTQMVEGINGLVSTSQSGVEEALEKIGEIDIETLNQAIEDLSNVVSPLADLIKRLSFGGLL